jgi:hypothetical protein
VSIQKFLPGSTVNARVHDFPNSYSGYIFENEFSSFNPIIFNSEEKNYRTVSMRHRHSNDEEEPIYGFFPSLNEIVWLKPLVLPNNKKVFAAFDEQFDSFFVASTIFKAHGTIPQRWNINIPFPDYLDCLVDACQLNCCQNLYFKIWDFFFKYEKYISNSFSRFQIYTQHHLVDAMETENVPFVIILLVLQIIREFFVYHTQMIPSYIFLIPFGYFLLSDNVVYSTIITKNFVYFWTIPSSLSFISACLYFQLTFFLFNVPRSEIGQPELLQIKHKKISWAVTYFITKKYSNQFSFEFLNFDPCVCKKPMFFVFMFFAIYFIRFWFSLPFSFFMMIQAGENGE